MARHIRVAKGTTQRFMYLQRYLHPALRTKPMSLHGVCLSSQ
jgi:hypothetical protein